MLIYVNQVGGQDQLVFDGASFVLNRDGKLAVQLPAWETALCVTEWRREAGGWRCIPGPLAAIEEGAEAAYIACAWPPEITLRKIASQVLCLACPAASIPRFARRWLWTLSARRVCIA